MLISLRHIAVGIVPINIILYHILIPSVLEIREQLMKFRIT